MAWLDEPEHWGMGVLYRERNQRVRAGERRAGGGPDNTEIEISWQEVASLTDLQTPAKGRGGGRDPQLEVVMVLVLHDIFIITRTSPSKSDRPAGLCRPSYRQGEDVGGVWRCPGRQNSWRSECYHWEDNQPTSYLFLSGQKHDWGSRLRHCRDGLKCPEHQGSLSGKDWRNQSWRGEDYGRPG